jgi:hypothetical protein
MYPGVDLYRMGQCLSDVQGEKKRLKIWTFEKKRMDEGEQNL